MAEPSPVWRILREQQEMCTSACGPANELCERTLERQCQLRHVGDTTRTAMEELSSLFSQALGEINLARSLKPVEGVELDLCRRCCRDGWDGIVDGLSWSYAAHTSCLVRQAAAMLALLASADEEVIGDAS